MNETKVEYARKDEESQFYAWLLQHMYFDQPFCEKFTYFRFFNCILASFKVHMHLHLLIRKSGIHHVCLFDRNSFGSVSCLKLKILKQSWSKQNIKDLKRKLLHKHLIAFAQHKLLNSLTWIYY